MEGSGSDRPKLANNTRKRTPNGPRSKGKPTQRKPAKNSVPKVKSLKNDYRYLEIIKLIKNQPPLTINGVSVSKLLEKVPPDTSKHAILSEYIYQIMEKNPAGEVYLSFQLIPSDPDFPFDIQSLNFSLCVPSSYPYKQESKPSIVVLNDDIPKGFAVNVEHGFRRIVTTAMTKEVDESEDAIVLVDGKGLLSQYKTLDKYLEEFLKQEKRQTVKFVKLRGERNLSTPEPKASPEPKKLEPKQKPEPKQSPEANVSREALQKRNQLVDEFINKFDNKTIKLFNKNASGSKYKVVLPLPQSGKLPRLWQLAHKLEILLFVPIDYPSTRISVSIPNNYSSNILLNNKDQLESGTEKMLQYINETKRFEKNLISNINATEFKYQSLVHIVNWVVNNIEHLGTSPDLFSNWCLNLHRLNIV